MFRPLDDRVLVKRDEEESVLKSGLIIPESAQQVSQRGTVIAVGPGTLSSLGRYVPLNISEGDAVVFSKYGGSDVEIDEVEYVVIKASDILGVIEP